MRNERPVGKITTKKLLQLLEYQQFRCALTGRELSPDTTALDHVTAVSKGGTHLMENVQAVHREANQAKRTLSVEEFIQLCREVVEWYDTREAADEKPLRISG